MSNNDENDRLQKEQEILDALCEKRRCLETQASNLNKEKKQKLNSDKMEFANELITLPLTKFTNSSVSSLKLTGYIQNNEMDSPILYLRDSQMELWNEVFDYISKGQPGTSNAIITGSDGIGKSRSMTYLLKLLLEAKKDVVYEARKDRKVISFFVQSDETYDVEVSYPGPTMKDYSDIAQDILDDYSGFYLIDPNRGDEGIMNVCAHTVLAASPNQNHFAEWSKGRGTLTWCMPVWTHDELKTLQKLISIDNDVNNTHLKYLDDSEFEERWSIFGGRIRFVYAKRLVYLNYYSTLKWAINSLGFEKIIKVVGNGVLSIDQESSMIFIYDVFGIATSDRWHYKWCMIDKNYQTSIASPYLRNAITIRYWKELLDRLDPKSVKYIDNATVNGRIFEFLAGFLLDGKFRAFDQDNLKIRKEDHQLELIHGVRQPPVPNLSNQPVVDMMDAKDRVYQFCAGKKHGVNPVQLSKIVEELKCTKRNPLRLYFVILESQADDFSWFWSNSNKNRHIIDKLKDLVKIFVIFPL